MIVEIIAKYLESNKRLVVPNFGAFIVKEAGRVVLFSNLIKGDDGVLRSLVAQNGVSELDAAAMIDRFVFEVNYRLEHSDVCALDGFGLLKSGKNGTVAFTLDTSIKGDVLDGDASEKLAAMVAENASENKPEEQPKQEQEVKAEVAAPQQAEQEEDGEYSIDVMPREEVPQRRLSDDATPRRERPRRNERDYVKGLRYGKGRKVVTGREGVTSRRTSKGDLIIKIAIGAAIIAVLALAYGFWNDWRNQRYMYEGLYEEEIYDEVPASAEEGVRNPDLDYITPKEN